MSLRSSITPHVGGQERQVFDGDDPVGAAAGALAWLTRSSFISLWCLWAAITSFVIVLHLRLADWPPVRARTSV